MKGFWTVPPMWVGRTVAILASGPSMSQAVANQVRGLPTIVINSTFRLAPWADMLYGADGEWWCHFDNWDALQFAGLRVSVASVQGVLRMRNDGVTGFTDDPQAVRTGSNSGYQALHIAVHAGAARVLLCGFDMGGDHWHAPHPLPLRETPQEVYPKWRERFATLAPILKARGVDVVNCSAKSALSAFRRASLQEAMAAELAPCEAVRTLAMEQTS